MAPHLRKGGKDFSTHPRARKAVEDRAMDLAREHLEGDQWEVEDVSASRSFDYIARRGAIELHVEVKGLVGSLPQVLLAISEKRHAE
jgi:hypothetical protein